MDKNIFYKKLRQARIDAKIRQDSIAKELNIPISAVCAMEKGKRRIDIFEMEALTKLYNKDIKWFLDMDNAAQNTNCYNKSATLEAAYKLIEQASPELQTAVAYAIIGFLKNGNLLK